MILLRHLFFLHLCLLLALSGCGAPETQPSYTVIGTADGAPEDCSAEKVAEQLDQLGRAINEKDLNLVLEFFDGGPFQWYSMGEAATSTTSERDFVAYTLDDLEAYFSEQFEQDENWELVELYVNSWDAGRGLVHFGPAHIRRTANDLSDELGGADNLTEGKGAYHCASKTFIVLSLGMNLEE